MKEIGISLTILRTIYVPDNSTIEEIEKAVERYFPSENTTPNKLSIQERIANKVKKESTKQ